MKKILTIIADGFGIRSESKDNAISLAKMHTYEQFFKDHPHTLLDSSNEAIGRLPEESIDCAHCHKVLGGGRVFHSKSYLVNNFWYQYDGNDTFNKLLKTNSKPTHLFCFLRKDNIKNIVECYNILKKNNFGDIYIHIIAFEGSKQYIEKFAQIINKDNLATLTGFKYLEDSNDEGALKYYKLLSGGNNTSKDINDYLKSYENWNVSEELFKPVILSKKVQIDMDDNIIWLDQDLNNTKVLKAIADLGCNVYTYFKVEKADNINYFIDNENDDNSLGVYLGKLNVKQARVAQNEKADILFEKFDSILKKIPNCDRFKIDGIKDRPEMSIVDITKRAIDLMEKDYTFIVINFANLDEYGKKGDMNLAIQACMSVDVCLAKLIEEAESNFYTIIFTSDHGRCENIKNSEKSSNLVPFIISDDKVELKEGGSIASFAATILDYMDITIPEEISSESLIVSK